MKKSFNLSYILPFSYIFILLIFFYNYIINGIEPLEFIKQSRSYEKSTLNEVEINSHVFEDKNQKSINSEVTPHFHEDCTNSSECFPPILHLRKEYKIYWCPSTQKNGIRFHALVSEGLERHPKISIVDSIKVFLKIFEDLK